MSSRKMEILSLEDSIHVIKDTGTEVNYYIFDEYEIHINRMKPHTIQEWHYHSIIEETLVITRGILTCRWLEDGAEHEKMVREHELVRVGSSVHTFENETDETVEFTVFRLVPDGRDKRGIMKGDKVVV